MEVRVKMYTSCSWEDKVRESMENSFLKKLWLKKIKFTISMVF